MLAAIAEIAPMRREAAVDKTNANQESEQLWYPQSAYFKIGCQPDQCSATDIRAFSTFLGTSNNEPRDKASSPRKSSAGYFSRKEAGLQTYCPRKQ